MTLSGLAIDGVWSGLDALPKAGGMFEKLEAGGEMLKALKNWVVGDKGAAARDVGAAGLLFAGSGQGWLGRQAAQLGADALDSKSVGGAALSGVKGFMGASTMKNLATNGLEDGAFMGMEMILQKFAPGLSKFLQGAIALMDGFKAFEAFKKGDTKDAALWGAQAVAHGYAAETGDMKGIAAASAIGFIQDMMGGDKGAKLAGANFTHASDLTPAAGATVDPTKQQNR